MLPKDDSRYTFGCWREDVFAPWMNLLSSPAMKWSQSQQELASRISLQSPQIEFVDDAHPKLCFGCEDEI